MILISNGRTSASKKINGMALIRTLTASTTAFERTKENFDGFRQTGLFLFWVYPTLKYTFRLNVLKSTRWTCIQNMIENMVLTSYLDKSYFVAS